MSSLWKKSAGIGESLSGPGIIRVPELSGKWKLGEEETGRIVRKQAFQEEKKRLGFSGEQSKKNGQFRVALAHNRNDLAETMLHHLAREPVSGTFRDTGGKW